MRGVVLHALRGITWVLSSHVYLAGWRSLIFHLACSSCGVAANSLAPESWREARRALSVHRGRFPGVVAHGSRYCGRHPALQLFNFKFSPHRRNAAIEPRWGRLRIRTHAHAHAHVHVHARTHTHTHTHTSRQSAACRLRFALLLVGAGSCLV